MNYSFGKKEKNKRKKETNKIVKINEREFKKFSVKKKVVYLANRYSNGSIKEVSRI